MAPGDGERDGEGLGEREAGIVGEAPFIVAPPEPPDEEDDFFGRAALVGVLTLLTTIRPHIPEHTPLLTDPWIVQ